MPSWNCRYFELTFKKLLYYVDETKTVLKGEFNLAPDMLVRDCNFRPFCFCLFQPGNNRRSDLLYLAASNMEEKQYWMSILTSYISMHRAYKVRQGEVDGKELSSKNVENDTLAAATAVKGIAIVKVIQARKIGDVEQEVSPYVLITLGSSIARTKSAVSTANPVWNETFHFDLDGTNRFIKFAVTNSDARFRDKVVGNTEISLMTLGLAGKSVKLWYKLTYYGEGTKKGFDGEVELEISVVAQQKGDELYEPFMRLLDQVKKLDPLQCTYSHSGIGRVEDEDEDNETVDYRRSEEGSLDFSMSSAFSIFMPQSPQRPHVRSERSLFMGSNTDSPANFFPMLHLEVPEDMYSTVALTSIGDDESVFCMGILILTNFRIIFVENMKIVDLPDVWDTGPAILTTSIALGDVLECSLSARSDDTIKSIVDILRIKTIDGRRFSFAFIENDDGVEENVKNSGTSGWQPPEGVAGGFVSKRGGRVSGRETVLYGFARGVFHDEELQQAYANIFKNKLYDYSFIDGMGSFEGTASHRIFQHVSLRTDNRYLIIYDMQIINSQTIDDIISYPRKVQSNAAENSLEVYLENSDCHKLLQIKFVKGWAVYQPEAEFKRLGAGSKWRICDVNKEYKLVSSYPELFFVPKAASDATVLGSIKFRSKGRLPVLSWINPSNRCCIVRSSQPLVGYSQKRSTEDEELLELINNTTGGSSTLLITDTRPKINAQANLAAGKGYESARYYENSKITFLGLANIHVIRKSFEAIKKVCSTQMKGSNNFMKNVESTGWLENVRSILDCAVCIAHWNMVDGRNVLVHGSDGYDRTPQLTSLVMLMLDPYYRTVNGFGVLIEKEWCSLGHKFKDRCGWSHLGWHDDDFSPLFEIFLHCVYQIYQEHPTAFQFNESFLLFLAESLYNGYFGNFIVNNDRERRQRLDKSFSIWFFVEEHKQKFISDNYDSKQNNPSSSSSESLDFSVSPVIPMVELRDIVLWQNRLMGWTNRVSQFFWTSPSNIDSVIVDEEEDSEDSSWLQSDQSEFCPKCQMNYSMFRRKVACKICSMIFCDKCIGPTKVCESCRVLESPLSKTTKFDDRGSM